MIWDEALTGHRAIYICQDTRERSYYLNFGFRPGPIVLSCREALMRWNFQRRQHMPVWLGTRAVALDPQRTIFVLETHMELDQFWSDNEGRFFKPLHVAIGFYNPVYDTVLPDPGSEEGLSFWDQWVIYMHIKNTLLKMRGQSSLKTLIKFRFDGLLGAYLHDTIRNVIAMTWKPDLEDHRWAKLYDEVERVRVLEHPDLVASVDAGSERDSSSETEDSSSSDDSSDGSSDDAT